MNVNGKLLEEGFNYALGRALRLANSEWRENPNTIRCERRQSATGKRPDLEIRHSRMPKPVVIECAYGGDNDRDARARLDQNICETAIALAIPNHFRSMSEEDAYTALFHGTSFGYAFLQRRDEHATIRFPQAGYIEGNVNDLAATLQVAAVPKERLEEVAKKVAQHIDTASEILYAGLSTDDLNAITATVKQRSTLPALRTVAVLWLDAMLVQAHVREQKGELVEALPLETEIRASSLIKAWRKILTHNWRSIFEPALDILSDVYPKSRRSVHAALQELLLAIEEIETSGIGQRISVAGELFPKISVDRDESAAFYTTPATAEMLATMLIRPNDHDWETGEVFHQLSIADLACGTGTLVRAGYHRIRELSESQGASVETISVLHKSAMEHGIRACDISPIASHLTNSGMALAGQGDPYGQTHIGWVSVGREISSKNGGSQLTTGSLEFLGADELSDMFQDLGSSASGGVNNELPIVVKNDSLDYVIMNPPYSRTRKDRSTFDIAGLSTSEHEKCQKRWEHLIKGESATKTAGMAASFLCLARKKVKPGGRIGFVLPLTAAFVGSWGKTRAMLVRDFENIVVLAQSGSKGGKDALSADTEMAEMLFVGSRKRDTNGLDSPVHCVSMGKVPNRLGEAREYARSIHTTLNSLNKDFDQCFIGEDNIAKIVKIRVCGKQPWDALGVSNIELALAARKLADDGVLVDLGGNGDIPLKLDMRTVEQVFEVGPTHHLIGYLRGNEQTGAYRFDPITRKVDTRAANCSIWNADSKSQRSLIVQPTHKGYEVDPVQVARIWDKRSTLHFSRSGRWTSQKLMAAFTPRLTHGGRAWLSLGHANSQIKKAGSLWANSTLGMLVRWTRASRTQQGRAPLEVNDLRQLPCPDFNQLAATARESLDRSFEDLKRKLLRPACQAHCDDVRKAIDGAVIEMLGLPEKANTSVELLRDLWCTEPSVHGNKREPLKLLKESELL